MKGGTDYLLGQLLSLVFYIMTLIIYNRVRREYAGGKIADAINLIMMFLAILLLADSADYFLRIFVSVGDDVELIIKILLKLLALSVLFFGGLRFFSKRPVAVPTEHRFSTSGSLDQASAPLAGGPATAPESPTGAKNHTKKTQPTLGRYEIIEQIGKGAMGIVYKGRDPKLQRLTAIKTIRFIEDYDDDKVEKVKSYFYHEAEVVARLSHNNIVTIYDVGEDLDLSYLAMEFLEGDSLETYCREGRLLPVHRTVAIIAQVCDALEYAHSQGIVHRDIKPGNIMVLKNGEVKVTDFGIARAAGSTRTRTGIIKGTPYYMSPEQARGQPLDGRADIFSTGVVFYHALTGKLPFTGENLAAIMYQAANTQPPPPSAYNPDVGQSEIDILNRALAKDVQDRFQTAGHMAEVLRSLGAGYDAKLPEVAFAGKAARKEIPGTDVEAGHHGATGEPGKESPDLSDSVRTNAVEARGRTPYPSGGTMVIRKKPDGELAASSRDHDASSLRPAGLSDSLTEPPGAASYQGNRTIVPREHQHKEKAVATLRQKTRSRNGVLPAVRYASLLLAGLLLVGGLGAGYLMLGRKPKAASQEQMLAAQKELARKIMQEKIEAKQLQADEAAQKQKALQDEQTESARKKEEQQLAIRQKLEEARQKQASERLARVEAEKKKEQARLEAMRVEKEKEKARQAAEEAARKAEAERIAEIERNKKAAKRQQDIQTVERYMQAADAHRQEKRFLDAKKGYETALAAVMNSNFQEDDKLAAFREMIASRLAADDIVYGSKGYVRYRDKWLSPEELELARYSEGFVRYKGEFRDHRTLKPTVNKLCEPLVQKYLTRKYSGRTVHTRNIHFQKMILTRNNAVFSQYAVSYKWAVSTFKGLDEDICKLDIKYTVETGKWSLLKGCE